MITKKQAEKLYIRQEIYAVNHFNADSTHQRWRVNGMCKTWKTRPEHFCVPIKHGLWSYDYLTHDNFEDFCLTEEEAAEQRAEELAEAKEKAKKSFMQKLSNMAIWTRKPHCLNEVKTSIDYAIYADLLDRLDVLDCLDLWDRDVDPDDHEPILIDFVNPTPKVFQYNTVDGRFFLIDTQGYNYPRYICEVIDSEWES